MVKLILLVLAIPNVISLEVPYCRRVNNYEWSCRNYPNFPTHLYNASTVEKLELSRSYDSPRLKKLNDLQLYKLPNLLELTLSTYVFYEVERGAFQNGGKLVSLTLLMNSLKRLDPQVFTDVPNLQKLKIIYQPSLQDFEKEFPKLENLTELVLEVLSIHSLKPNFLKNLKSLQILNLKTNKLTTLDNREVFRPLKNLKTLNFQTNQIRFVDPEVFADLQNLEILDLSYNILDRGFKNRTQFQNPNLIKLDLTSCKLKYIEEDLFQNLGNLKVLLLSDNNLPYIPQKMFSLKNLETLSLRGNSIKTLDGIFSGNLKSLDLKSNRLKSLDWTVLRTLNQLSTIFLNENPWQCDCRVLYLRNFLKQRNIRNENDYPLKCKTFGAKGEPIPHFERGYMTWKNIKPEELNCLAFPNITTLSAEPKFGENVDLQCDFNGDLPLQVIWMKDDVIVRSFTLSEDEPLQHNRTLMKYNDVLKIQNFKEEDAGLYKVVVSNEAGEIEKSEYLNLSKEPSTVDSADNTEQIFLHFLLEIVS